MKDALQMGLTLAVGLLVLDAVCFMGWVASGQVPTDNFYLGTITAHALGLVF